MSKYFWFFALLLPVGLYAIFILLLTIPWCQRIALYANNFSTSWIDDLDDPENWGFGKNQVTPFYVNTHDGQRLHAWHILPRQLYARHEIDIVAQELGKENDLKSTFAYQLMSKTPSKLIIMFHGNAGHLLQHHRPRIYHSFSAIDTNTHLVVFSYRGFGRSSGRPSEAGLITDGITIVDYAMNQLGIAASNMALVGQSLGTAVVSGVTEFYGTAGPTDVALNLPDTVERHKVDFGTIMLVAAFSDLKTLLLKYKIAGLIPILAPIAWIPGAPIVLGKVIRETWVSKVRMAKVIKEAYRDVAMGYPRSLNLQIIHALDDEDIPYENSQRIYDSVLDAAIAEIGTKAVSIDEGAIKEGSFKRELEWDGNRVSLRLFRRGGHNEIAYGTDIAVAVKRGLGLLDEVPV